MILQRRNSRYLSLCVVVALLTASVGGDEAPRSPAAEDLSSTFVTALYDIGRGAWPHFARPYDKYLQRFERLLSLDVRLVVFGEKSLKPFVRRVRGRRTASSGTRFVTRPFSELPAYRHKLRVECVMDSSDFREGNEKLEHPEAFSADYLVTVLSKTALLEEVAVANPFNTSHFFWIDAGYAAVHRSDDVDDDDDVTVTQVGDVMEVNVPAGTRWRPELRLNDSASPSGDPVTYIQLRDPAAYANVTGLFKRSVHPAIAGGFFGGSRKAVTSYAPLYNKELLVQLTEGEVGEDQGVALQVYFQHPAMFHLVKGGWFDAYRLTG